MSKYESFWKTTISQSSFRSAVGTAANGATDRVAVAGIRQCSPEKKNWSGIVRVRHGGIVPVSKGDLAAPAASLGKVLANDGMLAAWPTIVFRFAIDKAGDWLTVQAEENATKAPRVLMPTTVGAKPEPATENVESMTRRPHRRRPWRAARPTALIPSNGPLCGSSTFPFAKKGTMRQLSWLASQESSIGRCLRTLLDSQHINDHWKGGAGLKRRVYCSGRPT